MSCNTSLLYVHCRGELGHSAVWLISRRPGRGVKEGDVAEVSSVEIWGTDTLHCKFLGNRHLALQVSLSYPATGNASATHLQRTAATTTRPPEEHTALQGMTAMHLRQAQPSPNPGLALAPWAPTMARLSSRHAYRTQPPRLSHRRRSARCRRAPHARFFTQRSFTNPATCRHRLVALYSPCVCCSSWLHSQHAHSACRTTQHLWIVLDQP